MANVKKVVFDEDLAEEIYEEILEENVTGYGLLNIRRNKAKNEKRMKGGKMDYWQEEKDALNFIYDTNEGHYYCKKSKNGRMTGCKN